MTEALKRVLREYNLLSSAITLTIAFVLIMGWVELSTEQNGALLAALGAWMLVLRFLVTPVNDPVLKPGTTVNANTDRPTVIE